MGPFANSNATAEKNDDTPLPEATPASRDQMDVTALMDLLDKNKKNKPTQSVIDLNEKRAGLIIKPPSPKVERRINARIADTNTSNRMPHPVTKTSSNNHISLLAVIALLVVIFAGLLYIVDKQASTWVADSKPGTAATVPAPSDEELLRIISSGEK